jgi:phosphatidylglycerophosphate synthase
VDDGMIETGGMAATVPAPVPAGAVPHPGTASQRGTAVRDAVAAAVVAAVLCAVVAAQAPAQQTLVAALGAGLGLGVVAAAGASVVVRPGRWSGPADRVTLLRASLIGGCTTMSVLVAAGQLPSRPWWLFILLVPTLALDAVDGLVARSTGTASAAGGRLDGEMDAALLMVLSVAAAPSLGWWVLGIGLMRYVFFAAGYLRPQQRGHLAFSQFRRLVAALQGIMFAVALAPVVPVGLAQACVALALALLTVSFGIDVIHLERRARDASSPPGS